VSADEQLRPLPERTNQTGERLASPGGTSRREALRLTVVLWSIVAVFAIITYARSQQVGIPMRDPGGRMFTGRLQSAATLGLVLVVVDAVVRTLWRNRAVRGFFPAAWRTLRERWTLQRTALAVSGLVGYHVVYVCYRNLKSWDAFNTDRDQHLLDFDRTLFLGHSPAELLHGLLGTDLAARPLAFFYEVFVYVVVAAVVGSVALLPRVKDSYVMLFASVWVWILGVGSYYLVPSLGPFASAAEEFASLRPTGVTASQAEYLVDRAHLLANPAAPDAFASISAFASLHTAFTCAILLVAMYLRMRLLSIALAVYLAVVMVATIYFGMHFVVDDVAGIVIALVAVTLARLTVHWPRLEARDEG
jgi:membrane-associated phospholipid phosphatase